MSVELLIDRLSKEAMVVKPMTKPSVLLFKWLLGSVLYLGVMIAFFGIRSDITQKIGATLFTYELVSLLLIVITVSISAILLSYPDIYQRKYLVYLPIAPFLAFLGIIYASYQADNPPAPDPDTGLDCFLCICVFSIGPALVLLRQLRRQATTHPRITSSLAILASASFGALIFRLAEKTDSITHVLVFHYLPLIGFALIGVVLGKKLLRW